MSTIFLHPGYVESKVDGDVHYISARKLADLYQVDHRKCAVVHNNPERSGMSTRMIKTAGEVHLYPKFSGNYPAISGGNMKTGGKGEEVTRKPKLSEFTVSEFSDGAVVLHCGAARMDNDLVFAQGAMRGDPDLERQRGILEFIVEAVEYYNSRNYKTDLRVKPEDK